MKKRQLSEIIVKFFENHGEDFGSGSDPGNGMPKSGETGEACFSGDKSHIGRAK